MKEKIYTIPVNEAFDSDAECPLCYLRKKLEADSVEYSLGGAMMEPDYRINANEKGYCNPHYSMMLQKKEKLSLALLLETRMDEIIARIGALGEELLSEEKKGLFSKKRDLWSDACDALEESNSSCVICEKLSSTMERYKAVVFYLWEKEADFRQKLMQSRGFCLEHFAELICSAKKHLNSKKAQEFAKEIFDIEKTELSRMRDEVHKFTLKFDYRSRGEKWGSEADAPHRAVEKLSGYIAD